MNPTDHLRTSGVTIGLAVFLMLAYVSLIALARFSTAGGMAGGDERRF